MKLANIVLSVTLLLLCTASNAAERPNIVLIVADDMGRDWVSCYGAEHQTPNIDRLAKQGVRYETAWSMPLGMPARVTLLTGQYPFRHGWSEHDETPRGDRVGFDWRKHQAFVRALRDCGYATAIGGQWRLNDLKGQPDVLKHHGFDEHCVRVAIESDAPETSKGGPGNLVVTNGRHETVSDGSETINAFLSQFIRRQSAKKPFFIYYPILQSSRKQSIKDAERQGASRRSADFSPTALAASALPLTGKAPATSALPLTGKDAEQDKKRNFAEYVTRVDRLVGKLVQVVDDERLTDNTIIVLTSDNGSTVAGTLNGKPFEAGKGSPSDRGVHVPFIVRAPFLTAGGCVSRDLLDLTDIYPTFVELADAAPPENITLDGRSVVPSLRGSEDPFQKRNWIYSQLGNVRMIRDWQHILDSQGNFHDLTKDPLQKEEVSPLDKIAPGRRQRLQAILNRLPKAQ